MLTNTLDKQPRLFDVYLTAWFWDLQEKLKIPQG